MRDLHRGTLPEGSSCLRGRHERPGGSEAFQHIARHGPQDAVVFRAARLPSQRPGAATEAGSVHTDHRRLAGWGPVGPAQAAPYGEACVRSPSRRAWLHRRLHDHQGLHPGSGSAQPGDVRAAGTRTRPWAGRFWRSSGRDRRGGAEGALLRARSAAQRRLLRTRLSGCRCRGLDGRPCPRLCVLRRGAAVDRLRQRPLPGLEDPA